MAWTPPVSPGAPTGREGRTSSRAPPPRLSPPCLGALFSFWTSGLPLDLSLRCLPCCCCCCLPGLVLGWGRARVPPPPPAPRQAWTSSASGAGLRSPRRRRLGCRPRRRSWAWPQLRRKILGRPSPCPVASSRSCRASCPRTGRPPDLRSSSSFLRDASSSRSADCWSAAEEEEEFSTEVEDFSTDSCWQRPQLFSLDSCSTASAQLDTGVTVSEVGGGAAAPLGRGDLSLARFLGVGSCWALPCVRRSLLRASRHALQADWRTTAAHCALHLLSTRLALQLLCTTTAACSRRRRFL